MKAPTERYIAFRKPLPSSDSLSTKTAPRERAIIVWAVEPFLKEKRKVRTLLAAMDLWRGTTPAEIIPVAVLSPLDLNWPVELVAPLGDQLYEMAQRSLVPVLEKIENEPLSEPRILLQSDSSVRLAAETLFKFAKKEKAEIIAVNTRARRGIGRLGSFAERLIALSPIPVLAVNPATSIPGRISRVLFPTDYSSKSKKAFEKVVAWAARWNASITLFHRFDAPIRASFTAQETGLGMNAELIRRLYDDARRDQKKQSEKWLSIAHGAGAPCECVVSESEDNVADQILKAAKTCHADLIAMATHRGPIAQAILGSVARDVLVNSHRPVAILHV